MGSRIFIKEEYAMEEICRTCTQKCYNDFQIPIFKQNPKLEVQPYNIIKYFLDILQIEFVEDDDLPQNICQECYLKFVDFKFFLDKCLEANNTLFTYVEKTKSIEFFTQKQKVSINEESSNIDNQENEYLDSTQENQIISLQNIDIIKSSKKNDLQLMSMVKDHDYQDISLDIIEENNDNFESNNTEQLLDEETNLVEYDNTNAMKIDYITDPEYQVIDDENIELLDCTYCNYAFPADVLQQHINDYHPIENPFLCLKCFRNFRTQSIRDKHVLLNMCQVNEAKVQQFQNNAVEIFVAEDDYYDSRDIASEDEYFEENAENDENSQLGDMDMVSSEVIENSRNENLNDVELNIEKDFLKCPVCNEEFTKTKTFSEHLKRYHPDYDRKLIRSKYTCEICDKDCKSKQTLESHLNSHKGIKPFLCEICNTSFFGSKALRTHINNEHTFLQFNCEICGKEFSKKNIFVTHMSNHKKDNDPNRKPDIKYKCQFCRRTFNTVSTLTIHSLTHKKLLDSKHVCNVCGVTFKRADHLKMHMYGVHLDHKPFPCGQCDKSFSTAWQRNTHVKKYHSTEKKKYKCEICPNEYASSNALKRHHMVHTGELKYNCDVCDQKFPKIFLLEEHLKTHEIDETQRQESIHEIYMEIAKSVIIPN